jgi:hypothetical protein
MEIEHFNLWFINNFSLGTSSKKSICLSTISSKKKTNIGFFEGIATNLF